MSLADNGDAFVLDALELDGIEVGRDDEGRVTATRDLADDTVSLEDVFDVAYEHGLVPSDAEVDIPGGEVRVRFDGGGAA